MPFTLSHVAAVLPLLRNRSVKLSATGLIIGSVAPDFEKFMRMSLRNGHSHTWASIFYFSCPLALSLAFLFHLVVRDALLAHLPQPLRQRVAPPRRLHWPRYFRQRYGVVLSSVLLGAASHILWDAVTHRKPYLIHYLPGLLRRVPLLPFTLPLFKALELLSSVAGAALVLLFVWRLPKGTAPVAPVANLARYWRIVGITAGLLFMARVLLTLSTLDFWDVPVSALSATLFGIVVASLCCPSRPAARKPRITAT